MKRPINGRFVGRYRYLVQDFADWDLTVYQMFAHLKKKRGLLVGR